MKIKIIAGLILVMFCISRGLAYEDPKENELLFMAKKAYEDGFYEVSLGMLERFQRNYKNSPRILQANLLSGQCYFYQGRYLEALNIFEVLADNPESAGFKDVLYFWMGEVHFKGGNFEKSEAFYQKLINNFPQSTLAPAAYYSLGWAFSQEGKFAQAAATFEALIGKFPNEPQSKDAVFKLIESLYNLKDYARLKDKIKPIFKLYNNDSLRLPYLYFYLAESEYYLDNLDEAVKDYLKSAQAFKDPKAGSLAKLGLGWSYLKLKKYKEAEDVFGDIKPDTLDKKSLDIFLLGQAVLMSATNRVYESKKLYDQLINVSADPLISFQAYLGKADALYNLAEYEQAAKIYREGLDKINQVTPPGIIPAELIDKMRYNLGLAYIKQGKIDSSLDVFNSISGLENAQNPKINLLFQIGQAFEGANEFSKAQGIYTKILKLYPDSSYADLAQYRLASLQLKNTDYAAAAVSFEVLLKKYPQSKFLPDAMYALGVTYFQQTDYTRSIEVFTKFKESFRQSSLYPQALYMLGDSLMASGKTSEALAVFKDILRLDSLDSELLQKVEYEIADCYFKSGQENEAVSRFKLLRSKYPDSKLNPDILWWLGQYYYHNHDLSLSRRYFNTLTKDFSDSPLVADAFYVLGLTFSDEDKFEQAADNFKMAVKLGNADLRSKAEAALVDIYIQAGNPEAALIQYNKTNKNSSVTDSQFFYRMAQAYYKSGNYQKAKTFYSKSLESAPAAEAAGIRFGLAETLEANAEPEEAIQQYLLTAQLYTQDPNVSLRSLLRAAKLYDDRGNFKEALKIYKQIIQKYHSVPEADFARERIEGIKEEIKY